MVIAIQPILGFVIGSEKIMILKEIIWVGLFISLECRRFFFNICPDFVSNLYQAEFLIFKKGFNKLSSDGITGFRINIITVAVESRIQGLAFT
jgi:hypothetical protein